MTEPPTQRLSAGTEVHSAGAVVLRSGRQVLLVHRPRYDDWSFPKGKVERGEHPVAAAVREAEEETGLHVRLGVPLPPQRYPLAAGRSKHVSYWVGRVVGDDDVEGYRHEEEIDAVAWVDVDRAHRRLTYDRDRETLAAAWRTRRPTRALVVLRHGQARQRDAWCHDDRERPLVAVGRRQAERLTPLLSAYDVGRVVTSSSTRCLETLVPFVHATGAKVEREDALSEEDATTRSVRRIVGRLLGARSGAVICTHRPVLPRVFAELAVPDPGLDVGEMLVAHVRKGVVVDTERHRPLP